MRNLSEIDQSLITNSVASGVAIAFLLGYPIFKYIKEFNKMNQTGKSVLEIVVTTILMHIGFTLLLVGLATLMNIIVGDNTRFTSYAPKYGTAFIMGMFDSSGAFHNDANFWITWRELTQIAVNNKDTVALVIKSSLVVIGLAVSVLWFCLLAYPPFCILFPIFLSIRRDTQGNPNENTVLKKASYGLIICLTFVVLTFIHFLLASIYVSFQTDTHFSFWNQMTRIWSEILTDMSKGAKP